MSDRAGNGDESHPTRRRYLTLLGAGSAAGLAGCTGSQNNDQGSTEQNNQQQNNQQNTDQQVNNRVTLNDPIELYTWNLPFLKKSINGWMEDYKSQYGDEYKNLQTKWTDRGPATEDILSYFQSRLQSGNPPDVFDTQMTTFTRYANKGETGIWAPLGQYTDDKFLNKYYGRLIDVMTVDGQLLNMPFYMGTNATFSRRKWFDEAGIEPPTVGNYPSTMEYLDMAEQLVNNSGAEFGLTFIRFDWQIWPWFLAEGINVVNDDGTKVVFNTKRTKEILSRFRELTKKGVIPEVSWTGDWKPAAQQFGAGNTGMYFGSGSALRLVQNSGDWVSPDTMAVGGAPSGERYGALMTMHGLGVVKVNNSKKAQQAAFDLIRVILNKKWQKDFLRNTTVLVPHKQAVKELQQDKQFKNKNPSLVKLYKLWDDVSKQVWVPPLVSASSQMAQIVDTQFSAAALGEKSVDAAVKQAEQQCNQALQG